MSRPVPDPPGRRSVDADGVLRGIDVDVLALYLSRPSLALGLHPASPWADGAAPPPATGHSGRLSGGEPPIAEAADRRELGERLEEAVRRAVGNHRTVAVLHDGGLGATALLVAADAAARSLGAEVTVVVADHPAPDGASVAVGTQRVLAALGGRHRFLLAETDRPLPASWAEKTARLPAPPAEPAPRLPAPSAGTTPEVPGAPAPGERPTPGNGGRAWNPVAPDLGRTPLVRAAESAALRLGATLLLTPDGCAELLQAGPPALPPLLQAGSPAASRLAGLGAAGRQLADRWRADGAAGPLGGAAAVLGRGGRARRFGAGLHLALAPFADALGPAPDVLAAPHRERVEAWTAAWARGLAGRLAGQREPVRAYVLARMARFAGPLPAAVAEAAAVPRRSPFLDPMFTAWALRLPPAARYDTRPPTPYLRRNALPAGLVPRAARAALPRTEPPAPGTITITITGTVTAGPDGFPLCRELGLLASEDRGPVEPAVLARLAVLEEWLAGAVRISSPGRSAG
ncbi:hypothetical protein GCM10010149_13190 [Nonomuraea roseoviolacea subsp. roseoviolacea]|uniref:hypothetical protein n=1 Tax=Nonomuraea roseoviolacea TaxID=103837 RepID=UPI0031D44A18